MDGQPFYYLAELYLSSLSLRSIAILYPSTMNILPAQLSAVKRDWTRLRAHINLLDLNLLTGQQLLSLLNRLMSLKTRLLRCRRIVTYSSSRVRAQLLRSIFTKWRALIKRSLQIPTLSEGVIVYLRNSLQDADALDPHQWITRFILFDVVFLRPYLPELNLRAPVSAQQNHLDPYWRTIKGNPSVARL